MDQAGMQDILMWVERGEIADRTGEELDDTEQGVALLRSLLEENIQRVERGEDPMGVIRDASRNDCIRLGLEARERRGERTYASPPDRLDPVAAQIRQLEADASGSAPIR
jgi:5,5'-dehydrodivanillate O-demethylase